MNFFTEQDRAKRNTWVLVALMIVAVACLIALTTVAVSGVLYFAGQSGDSASMSQTVGTDLDAHANALIRSEVFIWCALAILTVVLGGSIYKSFALGGHGYKVAQALGGTIIPPSSDDPLHRKVLNVVEEMAIASGNPVPHTYLLPDESINAFAAGTHRKNAVIGVTRGCIEQLNRDELQGVIAHEFSHIHNGDMRMNLRLVAVLHGILLIGLIGSYLLFSGFRGHRHHHRHSRNKNQGAQMGLGLALWILGYCGVFFGNLIKAAVSRQREFLADASAVQFTRSPSGIANALKKIGGHSSHALIESANAEAYSHFYFGEGITSKLGALTATHPPLGTRIRRLEKHWDGQFIAPSVATPSTSHVNTHEGASGFSAPESKTPSPSETAIEKTINTIGNPDAQSLATAHTVLRAIPNALREAAHDPFFARALIYALVIPNKSQPFHQESLDWVHQKAHPSTVRALGLLIQEVQTLPAHHIVPLIESAIPALKLQSPAQYKRFKSVLSGLVQLDKKVSVKEWCIYRSVTTCCEPTHDRGNLTLAQTRKSLSVLLCSILRFEGNANPKQTFGMLTKDAAHLRLQWQDKPNNAVGLLDNALKQLAQLRPLDKPTVLKLLAKTIFVDNHISENEMLLFKAVADLLDCPIPLTAFKANKAV